RRPARAAAPPDRAHQGHAVLPALRRGSSRQRVKSFLQRGGIVVGGWVLTVAMLALFGYLLARSAPMQALISAHANGGVLDRLEYRDAFASMDKQLRIIRWVL